MVDVSNKIFLKNTKNKQNKFEKKIKILFKKTNENNIFGVKIIEKFLKNYKNKINFSKINLNYNLIITFKNLKKKKINLKLIYLTLIFKKKQTYTNIFLGGVKIFHITNGIVLKKNKILEKSRKKDYKTTLLNIITSIKYLNNSNSKNSVVVTISGIKPFFSKINKILKIELFNKNLIYIFTPKISFKKDKFKKVKSIKRRIRKKFNLIDV